MNKRIFTEIRKINRSKLINIVILIILIIILLAVRTNAQDFLPVKVCGQDSLTQVNKLKGKWKYVGHYYQRVYGGDLVKKPSFIIGDTSYIFTDTFIKYNCQVDRIQNEIYLMDYYNFAKVDTKAVSYRYMFRTKELPISVKAVCHNPYYELANEFILYKNTIYYDLDGIIYKFIKDDGKGNLRGKAK